MNLWERSGSVVECLAQDRGAAGWSLTGVTAWWSLSKNIIPSLVLVQPRKTLPFITERLLMGRKESNQTNNESVQFINFITTPDRLNIRISYRFSISGLVMEHVWLLDQIRYFGLLSPVS